MIFLQRTPNAIARLENGFEHTATSCASFTCIFFFSWELQIKVNLLGGLIHACALTAGKSLVFFQSVLNDTQSPNSSASAW